MADENATTDAFNLRGALEAGIDAQDGVDVGEGGGETEAPASRDDGRDERGRFARKENGDEPAADDDAGDRRSDRSADRVDDGDRADGDDRSTAKVGDEDPAASAPPAVSPPPGWSVASKAAWNDLPEAVRADIAKRETEVSNGFAQYKGLGELKPYAEAYERSGLSIKQQFDGYLQMDRALQTNFPEAIRAICQHYRVDPAALGQELTPRGAPQGEPQPDDPIRAALSPLQREIAELKQARIDEQRAAQQREQTSAAETIQAFAADPKHPYFENVKATMGRLIQTGEASDLSDAYEKACWANPEIRAVRLKQEAADRAKAETQRRQAAATQARASAKSLTGAPTPGGSSAKAPTNQPLRSRLEAAIDAQGARA